MCFLRDEFCSGTGPLAGLYPLDVHSGWTSGAVGICIEPGMRWCGGAECVFCGMIFARRVQAPSVPVPDMGCTWRQPSRELYRPCIDYSCSRNNCINNYINMI